MLRKAFPSRTPDPGLPVDGLVADDEQRTVGLACDAQEEVAESEVTAGLLVEPEDEQVGVPRPRDDIACRICASYDLDESGAADLVIGLLSQAPAHPCQRLLWGLLGQDAEVGRVGGSDASETPQESGSYGAVPSAPAHGDEHPPRFPELPLRGRAQQEYVAWNLVEEAIEIDVGARLLQIA